MSDRTHNPEFAPGGDTNEARAAGEPLAGAAPVQAQPARTAVAEPRVETPDEVGDRPAAGTREPTDAQDQASARPLAERATLRRHGWTTRLVHWSVALSSLLLIFSGFGQMPMYHRYKIDQLPLLSWSSDFSIAITLHYLAAALLVFAAVYHLVLHGLRREFAILPRRGDFRESYLIIKAMLGLGKEPPSDKYLAEQRLAYAFIAGTLLLLIGTGVVKVLKNVGVELPYGLLWTATTLHNLATFALVFGFFAHLGAFLFKENRQLLGSMFHGRVDLQYAVHRHARCAERRGLLVRPEQVSEPQPQSPETSTR